MHKLNNKLKLELKGADSRRFIGYANVKGIVDLAGDRSMDGCFKATIAQHKSEDSMPLGLWNHNQALPQIVAFHEWSEDTKGLLVEGEFLSGDGICEQVYQSAKSKAKLGMSIGYSIPAGMAKSNPVDRCTDVFQYDIGEISMCNFAVNQESHVDSVKAKIASGEIITLRDMQDLLQDKGMSKRQAEKAIGVLRTTGANDELLSAVANSSLFQ